MSDPIILAPVTRRAPATTAQPLPDGYIEDAQGRLVPLANLRPELVQADETVRDLAGRALAIQAQIAEVKRAFLDDIAAHCALVAERYGVALSGKDGNVVLTSYDGRFRVERVTADRLFIGEEILAAEQLIREMVDEIEDPVARTIVNRAFRRHRKTGELSFSRLVDLVAVEIDDPRWQQAVKAIREAMRTAGSVTYFRAYHRADPSAPWQQIQLDFSAIQPAVPGLAGAAS